VKWWAWKRYVLIALSAVILFFVLPGIFGESDKLSHIPDDILISVMAIAAIALIAVFWKSIPLRSRTTGRQLVEATFVIALLAQVAGFVIEYSDANDVGNEYIGFALIGVALVISFI
jgi:hypothetical protein